LGPLAVALVAACAGRDGEPDDPELLTAILREAPARVSDVAPILVHPQELKLAGIDDPYAGVSPDHYHAGSWGALAEAGAFVATELSGPYGYAAQFYQVERARRDGVWEVVDWRPRGSAN
jgi:hypothetical protein